MTNIAIIGAGLAGLTVANYLRHQARVTLFDKARGVSGRMSTRRAYSYYFDHGAQFFTVRHPAFQSFIQPMIDQGIIQPWHARFVEIDNRQITNRRDWATNQPHYVGVPSMNAIGKYLSRGLQVELKTRVASIEGNGNLWTLRDHQGNQLGDFDWVVLAMPARQVCDILPASLGFYSKVQAVTMKACFSLMLGFDKTLPLSFDAALVRGDDISWISVDNSKPGRDNRFRLLVHATNQWADDHIDDPSDRVRDYLCDVVTQVINYDVSQASYMSVHRWRYANINKQQVDNTYFLDRANQIAACGDWFIKGRVEAAFTSGYDLANDLMISLDKNS